MIWTHQLTFRQSKELRGLESAKYKYLLAPAAPQKFPITGASSTSTRPRQQSQHQIEPRGPLSVPRRPNQSPPPGRKTNPPQTHPSTCSGRPKAARQRGDARPHYCARRRALPGVLAYLAAVPAPRRRPAGWGAGGARARPGVGAPPRLRPLCLSPGADRRLPAPGGAAGGSVPGSRPLPGSQRVRFSFTTKSPRHCNPTGGRSGRTARAGAGAPPRGPKVGRERARGRWPETGSRRLDLLVTQLRRRGAEEPVLPKTNRKWVTERPGQR